MFGRVLSIKAADFFLTETVYAQTAPGVFVDFRGDEMFDSEPLAHIAQEKFG